MLVGADLDGMKAISAAAGDGNVIASGGVGELTDLTSLVDLKLPNLEGVIVGKALYEKRFTLAEALNTL
jgi:phosphoribosylformimino-5-aminoimidazole carboxamide ribonucleotide (ProFAR) isomerase